MNIVLVGFMGTGKSTIGRLLAHQLDWEFIDVDARIETEQDLTVTRIFQTKGEACFRRLETEMALKLAKHDHQVISTGGGFVLNPLNINALKPKGTIIALTATPEVIYQRIKNEGQRPLLAVSNPLSRIGELLLERAACYQGADFQIDTTFKKPSQIVTAIIEELTRRGFIDGRNQTEFS